MRKKNTDRKRKFKIEAIFPPTKLVFFRHNDFEMINTKMPNWRHATGTQEIKGLDKYLGVISIWMTEGVKRKGSG